MSYKKYLAALAGLAITLSAQTATAQVKFGICYDISKAYTFISPQVSQAAKD